jgi:hypothetical protein
MYAWKNRTATIHHTSMFDLFSMCTYKTKIIRINEKRKEKKERQRMNNRKEKARLFPFILIGTNLKIKF